MLAYWISVLLFALFCIITSSIFYLMIKIQEKKFKKYMNEKLIETINMINNATRDMIGLAIDVVDSELRDKYGKN